MTSTERWASRLLRVSLGVGFAAGALGGTLLALRLAWAGAFLAVSPVDGFIAQINATVHAVIFGWLVPFALAAALRAAGTRVPRPAELPMAVIVYLAGLAAHLGGRIALAVGCAHGPATAVTLLGSAGEIGALLLMLPLLGRWAASTGAARAPLTIGALCAVLAAAGEGWHAWAVGHADGFVALVAAVSCWQPPLRYLEVHALALVLLVGLAQALLPPPMSARRQRRALGLILVATMIEMAAHIAYRLTHHHAFAGVLLLPWILLPIGAWLALAPWRWWRRPIDPAFAAAAACLFASLALQLGFRPYHVALGQPFSHHYFAAMSQPAVGFIILLVMALAPRLGIAPHRVAVHLVWSGLVLVVAGMIGLDWPQAAPWARVALAVGAVLEGSGLGWWTLTTLGRVSRDPPLSGRPDPASPR